MSEAKLFCISKWEIWEAYKRVKGSFSISREWTDWADQSPYCSLDFHRGGSMPTRFSSWPLYWSD